MDHREEMHDGAGRYLQLKGLGLVALEREVIFQPRLEKG